MTLNDKLIQMQANLESAKTHIADLEKGRKASSSKARSELMKVKKMSHDLRKQCIVSQKSIPVKSRVKVTPTTSEPISIPVPEVIAPVPETPEVPETRPPSPITSKDLEVAKLPKKKGKAK